MIRWDSNKEPPRAFQILESAGAGEFIRVSLYHKIPLSFIRRQRADVMPACPAGGLRAGL